MFKIDVRAYGLPFRARAGEALSFEQLAHREDNEAHDVRQGKRLGVRQLNRMLHYLVDYRVLDGGTSRSASSEPSNQQWELQPIDRGDRQHGTIV